MQHRDVTSRFDTQTHFLQRVWNFFFSCFLFILGCAESLLLCRLFFTCCKRESALLVAVHGLLIVVVSPYCREGALQCTSFSSFCMCISSWSSQAPEHRLITHGHGSYSMWDPPGPRIKPLSHALADEFFTTEPLGKALFLSLFLVSGSSRPSSVTDTEVSPQT